MISGCIVNLNSSSSTGLRKSIEQLTTWTVHGREAEIARQRSSSHLRRHCVVCSRWPGGLMPENRGWKTNHGSLPTCGVRQGASMITAVRYSLSRIVSEFIKLFCHLCSLHIRERFMIFRGIGEDDQKFQNVYCSNEVSGFSKKCSLLFNLGSSKCCHVQNHIALQVPKSIVISQLKIMTK